MNVRMTRTVRHFDVKEPFQIGEVYDLPKPLAETWILYGVCTAAPAEKPVAKARPARRVAKRERAAQDGLT